MCKVAQVTFTAGRPIGGFPSTTIPPGREGTEASLSLQGDVVRKKEVVLHYDE